VKWSSKALGGKAMSIERRSLLAIGISILLGGCAIHPLPENVTGVKTTRIVHRIRCEARAAVLEEADKLHSPQALHALKTIGIVYSFSLSGTETDGFTPSATFISGGWTFNPAVGDTVIRQNVRTFTIIDNFQVLRQMDGNRCEAEPTGPNYQYPIVGTIGIGEMIKTFIAMAMHTNLEAGEGQSTGPNGPPTMVDTISFTTTLTAGITPTLALTPVGSGAQLTGASLGVNLTRADIHQVIVGLALPSQIAKGGPPAHAFLAGPRVGMLVSGTPRTTGEAAALEAVNNQIIRYQLPRPLIVTP
jgi:hypothetical protein